MRRVLVHLLRVALAALVALGIVVPIQQNDQANKRMQAGVPAIASGARRVLAHQLPDRAYDVSMPSSFDTYYVLLHTYASMRVRAVAYDVREPRAFGPWDAPVDLDAQEANNDGLLTQWSENYYIAHDWSDFGPQITSMVPGDTVVINGRRMVVKDIFDYPRDAYLDEVRELVGYDSAVLQTCETGTDYNRIVYAEFV